MLGCELWAMGIFSSSARASCLGFRQSPELASSAVQSLVISTNSWMGGKNLFLGVCYLVIAGLALLVSIAFLVTYHLGCFGLVKRRKFGDVSQLSWNKNVVTH